MKRDLVTLLAILLNVLVGLPCLCFGILGMSGTLADISLAENRAYGAGLLSMGCSLWMATVFWFRSKK